LYTFLCPKIFEILDLDIRIRMSENVWCIENKNDRDREKYKKCIKKRENMY